MSTIPVKQTARRYERRRRARPRRDLAVLEEHRMQAAELFEQGVIPAEVARRVGVQHQIVSQWRKAWRQGGRDALRSAGPVGRKPRLTSEQLETVKDALLAGPIANGYYEDVWTLPRVGEVIKQKTGVAYHPGHVWHWLRGVLDWSWQRPARRAVERHDEAIEHWVKKRWPQLKKGRGARTH